MITVYKFPLDENAEERQIIDVPANAEILTLQTQGDTPCLWVKLDDEEKTVDREILIIGTGQPFPDGLTTTYIGTCQFYGGTFVLHAFEITGDEYA